MNAPNCRERSGSERSPSKVKFLDKLQITATQLNHQRNSTEVEQELWPQEGCREAAGIRSDENLGSRRTPRRILRARSDPLNYTRDIFCFTNIRSSSCLSARVLHHSSYTGNFSGDSFPPVKTTRSISLRISAAQPALEAGNRIKFKLEA